MIKPKMSYVIPVYNGKAFLSNAIESCLNQTEKNIEVIVVNDGSTDCTQQVIDYYVTKDSRVKSIIINPNAGRSNARNVGSRKAESDIIAVLDHDDVNLPGRTRDTLKEFKFNPKADIVYGNLQVMDAIGNIMGNVETQKFNISTTRETYLNYICHSTMAYKKSIFDNVSYTSGDFCKNAIDDWKFQIDCYKAGYNFSKINSTLCKYRIIKKQRDNQNIVLLKKKVLEEL